MKKLILLVALFLSASSVFAQQTVNVSREALGSGTPGAVNDEAAVKWDNNILHSPQYMPGHPTAATIYPRVIDVPCTKTATGLKCKGYNWSPDMGRGEYLMVRPVVQEATPPVVITVIKEVPAPIPVTTKKIAE